jgi:hypothetical protein
MRVWFSLLAFILLSPFTPSSEAATCKAVNLYENPESPLHQIPIYDQGDLPICYAYTASQLIDYYLIERGLPRSESVHPFWIAYNHKANAPTLRSIIQWKKNRLGYSYMKWAFQDLRRNGACPAPIVQNQLDRFDGVLPEENKDDVNRTLASTEVEDEEEGEENVVQESQEELEDIKSTSVHEDPVARDKRLFKYLKTNLAPLCRADDRYEVEIPAAKVVVGWFSSNSKVARTLSYYLERKNPVGIGYCSNIFRGSPENPISYTYRKGYPRLLRAVKKGCSAHYSVLVGQRPNEKSPSQCDYLIRNSYGKGYWSKSKDCICQTSTGEQVACRYSAENPTPPGTVLGCWVGQSLLTSNLFDAEVLR